MFPLTLLHSRTSGHIKDFLIWQQSGHIAPNTPECWHVLGIPCAQCYDLLQALLGLGGGHIRMATQEG